MTVVNPKSISGINSITTGSGSDDILTIHTNNGTERLRIDSTGATKIVTGIVTTLTATTGIVTHFTADKISLPDSSDGSLCIGIGSDFKINHNGGHSYITEVGGGDLYIQGSDIILRDAGTLEKHIEMTQNGAVDLYHNGSKKFETISAGVRVTGNMSIADGSTSSGKVALGTGDDLNLYHTGTDSYIENKNGDLYISTTNSGDDIILYSLDDVQIQVQSGEDAIKCIGNGAVELYHDNTKRFATTDKGADVFGNGTTNNVFKLINTSGTSNASHHMTLDTYNASGYWSDLKIDASNIQLNTYTGNRATLSNTALTFASGVNIAMASGNGIDFSATSDASGASSEVLDDYEEGSWTATLVSGGASINNDAQNNKYVKIGSMVFITGEVNQLSNPNGNTFEVGGLPYQIASQREGAGSVMSHSVDFSSGRTMITLYVYAGQTKLRFYTSGSGVSWRGVKGDEFSTSGAVIFSFAYHTV